MKVEEGEADGDGKKKRKDFSPYNLFQFTFIWILNKKNQSKLGLLAHVQFE